MQCLINPAIDYLTYKDKIKAETKKLTEIIKSDFVDDNSYIYTQKQKQSMSRYGPGRKEI